MSISIVVKGQLWGLFACHHMSTRLVPHAIRIACYLLSQVVSVLVERTEANEHADAVAAKTERRVEIIDRVKSGEDILNGLTFSGARFIDLLDCDGGAVSLERRVEVIGEGVAPEAVSSLVEWLGTRSDDVFHTDSLCHEDPGLAAQLGSMCGVLAVRFHREQNGYVIWLRREQIETVRWGGNSLKVIKSGPMGDRLTPRGSFEEWREEVRGRSVPWTNADIEVAQRLRRDLQDVALANAAKLDRARDMLLAALGHDLRDPLQAISMSGHLLTMDSSAASAIGKRITSSSSRMQRMIAQILDISRIQSGLGLGLEMRDVDIGALVSELVQETQMAHPSLQIDVDIEPLGHGLLDRDRFSQVISNLVSNARHHGVSGKPIAVRASRMGDDLVLSITNHGERIPDALLHKLFQPFKPESLNKSRNRTGLGIGLHIAHEIVRGHGGSLQVEQASGLITFKVVAPAFA